MKAKNNKYCARKGIKKELPKLINVLFLLVWFRKLTNMEVCIQATYATFAFYVRQPC